MKIEHIPFWNSESRDIFFLFDTETVRDLNIQK